MKTKRITINVNEHIDLILAKIKEDTGVSMTYVQVFNYLIHFYMKQANVPKTQWAQLKVVEPRTTK